MSENEAPVEDVETTETETETPEQQAPKPTETVDFWKSKAREQEKRAKENAACSDGTRSTRGQGQV
jgi:hypothetical protein